MKQIELMTLRRIVTEIQDERAKRNQLFQEWEDHQLGDTGS
jgi:hypothetical protein